MDNVIQTAPAGFKLFMDWMTSHSHGRQLLDQVLGANVVGATGWATSTFTGVGGQITRALGYAVIALFVAIYLAAQPERYRHLCLRLVPPAHRPAIEHLFGVTGHVLQRWLVGQLVVMATIGVLTGIGPWLIGIEAAFALGLIGGLLCFIPFVGAILAAVPATLVALTQGPIYAALVVCMYVGVHFIEGNFITPMVQAEATSFPPVFGNIVDRGVWRAARSARSSAGAPANSAALGGDRGSVRAEGTWRGARGRGRTERCAVLIIWIRIGRRSSALASCRTLR